jgi:periplasmic divalent cation tolerance protein
MNCGIRIILTTFATEACASAVVRALLEERLIACGNMIPDVRSLYRWKGSIEESAEIQVFLKTDQSHASLCMQRLEELHPYDAPEILLLDPVAASAPYSAWLRDALRMPE